MASLRDLAGALRGGVLDLNGRTVNLAETLNITEPVVLRNGTLTATDTRVALITAPGTRAENVHFVRTGDGGRTGADAALTINAENVTLVDTKTRSTVGDGLRLGNGACAGFLDVRGDHETSDPNDACGFHLVSGARHNYDIRLSHTKFRNAGFGTGMALYNCSRTTVIGPDVRGVRASPWFYPTGWEHVAGTVYRARERGDTFSNAVWVDLVEYRKDPERSTTTPQRGRYTAPGDGYLYMNTGGDPTAQEVRTRRTNGYGLLMYSTSTDTIGMSDNLIDSPYVEDTDGFGIYYQNLHGVPRNNRIRNATLRDVCKMGIAVGDLPFAAIGVFGGLDLDLDGVLVDGAGTTGDPCPGIDFKASEGTPHMTGRLRSVTVKRATGTGVQLAPGTWDLQNVNVESGAGKGIGHGVLTPTDTLRVTLSGCSSTGNANSGVHFEVNRGAAGATVQITFIGGHYTDNQRNIVLVGCQDVYVGSGVRSAGASNYGVVLSAATRAIIDGLFLGAGRGLSVSADSTGVHLGAVIDDGSPGTKVDNRTH